MDATTQRPPTWLIRLAAAGIIMDLLGLAMNAPVGRWGGAAVNVIALLGTFGGMHWVCRPSAGG